MYSMTTRALYGGDVSTQDSRREGRTLLRQVPRSRTPAPKIEQKG